MDANAARQTLALRPNATVIINIGLGPAKVGVAKMSAQQVVAAANKVFHECLVQGAWRGEILEAESEDDEATIAISGTFTPDISSHDLLWSFVEATGQDCIAIWYSDIGEGVLFGPAAEQWGAFDKDFFKLPSWLLPREGVFQC